MCVGRELFTTPKIRLMNNYLTKTSKYYRFYIFLENSTPRRSPRKRSPRQFYGHVWCVDCLLADWIGEGGIVISEEENESDNEENENSVSKENNLSQHKYHNKYICFKSKLIYFWLITTYVTYL